MYKILISYKFNVTILADRGFKSTDLLKFINETLEWKYCIRCTKDLEIDIDSNNKIKKLEDIILIKSRTKYFYDIKLTAKEYICDMVVCKVEERDDAWFIANNILKPYIIRGY